MTNSLILHLEAADFKNHYICNDVKVSKLARSGPSRLYF